MTPLGNGRVWRSAGAARTWINLTSCEVYDPAAGAWSPAGAIRLARHNHTATSLPNGKLLVIGGTIWNSKQGGFISGTASCELFDPAARRSASTGSLRQPRTGHAAVLLPNGKVLVAGGDSQAGPPYYTTGCELFDPASGRWSATGSMLFGRTHHQALLLPNGMVLVIGGELGGEAMDDCELYDSKSGRWSIAAPMTGPRAGHTATLLADGHVLAAGGYESFQIGSVVGHQRAVATSEIYDPVSDMWSPANSLAEARHLHTATLMADGKVLVSGGLYMDSAYPGSAFADLSSCELFDPATGMWSPTAPMNSAREGHVGVRLPNGRVLVTCGSNGSVGLVESGEVYEP